jgi:hypothetical protein
VRLVQSLQQHQLSGSGNQVCGINAVLEATPIILLVGPIRITRAETPMGQEKGHEMKLEFRIFIISILVLIPCACSTMQPVDTGLSQQGLKDSIVVGDELVIYTKARADSLGGKHTVLVKSVTEEKIVSEDADQNEMEFYFNDTETIEKDKFSARETARGAGAVALYTLLMLGFVAMYLAIGAAI